MLHAPDHPFHKRAASYIQKHRLIEKGDRLLVGVSGGPDSVALLRVLKALEPHLRIESITVAHFDHQLRGKESSLDGEFVRRLAAESSLPLYTRSGDVLSYQKENRVSLEMAARACRHAFFREALAELKANRIALGHTANDQAEEILLRLFRGTGPAGLAGMLPSSADGIIRPILFARRAEVVDYLDALKLSYRLDSSNLAAFCQRNSLRLKVFPLLEDLFHHKIIETLSRHAALVQDEESYWIERMRSCWPEICAEESRSGIALRAKELGELHPAFRRRLLRFAVERLLGDLLGFYAVHIEALSRLVEKEASGKSLDLPRGVLAFVEGGRLVLSSWLERASEQDLKAPEETPISNPGAVFAPSFALRITIDERPLQAGSSPSASSHTVWMDADKVRWPLALRSWKPGDRFFPLGMRGAKKLQDFFTDAKIARAERGRIPLLWDNEKICWVVGHRLDERVKVTEATHRVLVVEAAATRIDRQ